jgi:hypothetical protein
VSNEQLILLHFINKWGFSIILTSNEDKLVFYSAFLHVWIERVYDMYKERSIDNIFHTMCYYMYDVVSQSILVGPYMSGDIDLPVSG